MVAQAVVQQLRLSYVKEQVQPTILISLMPRQRRVVLLLQVFSLALAAAALTIQCLAQS
jgi:hypothetical protein